MAPRKSGLFLDHAKAVEITKQYAEKYNLHVEPEAKVMDIPVGMKQKVEILKALVRGAQILILDEPTAVLTTQETAELFKELIHLKEQGYTIVFISHKLNEIMGGGLAHGNWTPAAEFNILVDPEAAKIVFASGVPILMAGLDVTEKALILPEDFQRVAALGNPVADIVAQWLEFFYVFHKNLGYAGAPMHDPCAVMAADRFRQNGERCRPPPAARGGKSMASTEI